MPLGKCYLGKLDISSIWLQVPRSEKKKGKKERKKTFSFLLEFVTCNFPFLLFVIILDSFQVVIFFHS
jgi:hypothetical protein